MDILGHFLLWNDMASCYKTLILQGISKIKDNEGLTTKVISPSVSLTRCLCRVTTLIKGYLTTLIHLEVDNYILSYSFYYKLKFYFCFEFGENWNYVPRFRQTILSYDMYKTLKKKIILKIIR